LNEAQLINLQGTNKNMATRDLLKVWLEHGGKNIYNKDGVTIIEGNKEYLIVVNQVDPPMYVHLTVDRVMVLRGKKRYVVTIPLRGRPRRGMEAIRAARAIISFLPLDVIEHMGSVLPWLALVA
jgi:hypothetical protein